MRRVVWRGSRRRRGGVRAEARVGWLIALPTRPRRLALLAERFGAWKHYKCLMKGVSEAGVYQASFPLPQLPLHWLAVKPTPLVPPRMWLAAPRRPRHITKRPQHHYDGSQAGHPEAKPPNQRVQSNFPSPTTMETTTAPKTVAIPPILPTQVLPLLAPSTSATLPGPPHRLRPYFSETAPYITPGVIAAAAPGLQFY